MRISDWSSDVCSSDLLPTSLWLRFGGFGERDIIMTLRNILLGATMLCAATTPAYAYAQDAAAPADTGTAVDDSDYGNDIIVTASKRSQTLQDTPVAVSVTSAAQLEDARSEENTSELQSLMRTSYAV